MLNPYNCGIFFANFVILRYSSAMSKWLQIYWRQVFVRTFLACGAVAWLLGGVGAVVHQALVQHVVCAEHGQVEELVNSSHGDLSASDVSISTQRSEHDTASLYSDNISDNHDHDCSLDLTSQTAASSLTRSALPQSTAHHIAIFLTRVAPPRGPPLAYSPKTSPPKQA